MPVGQSRQLVICEGAAFSGIVLCFVEETIPPEVVMLLSVALFCISKYFY